MLPHHGEAEYLLAHHSTVAGAFRRRMDLRAASLGHAAFRTASGSLLGNHDDRCDRPHDHVWLGGIETVRGFGDTIGLRRCPDAVLQQRFLSSDHDLRFRRILTRDCEWRRSLCAPISGCVAGRVA